MSKKAPEVKPPKCSECKNGNTCQMRSDFEKYPEKLKHCRFEQK